jgi:hypothetical protein
MKFERLTELLTLTVDLYSELSSRRKDYSDRSVLVVERGLV